MNIWLRTSAPLTALGLVIGSGIGLAAPFRNLGFDDVDVYGVSNENFGMRLALAELALPGWSSWGIIDISGPNVSTSSSFMWVGVDQEPRVFGDFMIYTTNIYQAGVEVPVEGRNSLAMYSRYPAISELGFVAQTGDVPSNANSLHFLNYDYPLDLYVNGSFVPVIYRIRTTGTVPVSDGYGDISAFSGQTVELRFVTADLPDMGGILRHGLDSISFSPEKLTEAQVFTRVTEGAIATDHGLFSACAWADAENNGYADLFAGNKAYTTAVVYANQLDGTFKTVPFFGGESSTGGLWGDFDNDGFADLLRTADGIGGGIFLQINGSSDQNLTPISAPEFSSGAVAANPAAADLDGDGLLDFAVCRSIQDSSTGNPFARDGIFIYRNLGARQFQAVKLADAPSPAWLHYSPIWADYDNDGKIDLFVLAFGEQNLLFHNDGNGMLTRVGETALSVNTVQGIAAAWGDYDNDGFLDLFIANGEGASNLLFHNNRNGTFSRVTNNIIAAGGGNAKNCAWGDYDNDGFLDLFVANRGADNALYHNNGDGSFSRVSLPELHNPGSNSTSCAWADYDNDGYLDLFVTNSDSGAAPPTSTNFLYHNNGNTNNWMRVRCYGALSNRSAIGAKVRVRATISGRTLWQMREISGGNGRSQNDLALSFGLGDATVAEIVRIEWPSGINQEFRNVPARQSLVLREPALALSSPGASGGQFHAEVIASPQSQLDLQASADLVHWTTMISLMNVTGRMEISEPLKDARDCFFRLLER